MRVQYLGDNDSQGFAQVHRSNETATLPGPLKTGQLIGMWSFSVAW